VSFPNIAGTLEMSRLLLPLVLLSELPFFLSIRPIGGILAGNLRFPTPAATPVFGFTFLQAAFFAPRIVLQIATRCVLFPQRGDSMVHFPRVKGIITGPLFLDMKLGIRRLPSLSLPVSFCGPLGVLSFVFSFLNPPLCFFPPFHLPPEEPFPTFSFLFLILKPIPPHPPHLGMFLSLPPDASRVLTSFFSLLNHPTNICCRFAERQISSVVFFLMERTAYPLSPVFMREGLLLVVFGPLDCSSVPLSHFLRISDILHNSSPSLESPNRPRTCVPPYLLFFFHISFHPRCLFPEYTGRSASARCIHVVLISFPFTGFCGALSREDFLPLLFFRPITVLTGGPTHLSS